jgi:type IV pilus assembly protein PilW
MKRGFSLVELLVAMTIGIVALAALLSLLSSASRALRTREAVAEMQERARFAMATLETDVQLAGYYGLSSRGAEFRYLSAGDTTTVTPAALLLQSAAPLPMPGTAAHGCGDNFAIDLSVPIQGDDNRFRLGGNRRAACAARGGGARNGADTLTVRRAATSSSAPDANRMQLLVDSLDSQHRWLLNDAVLPAGFALQPAVHELHNLSVRSYYVANDSVGDPGVPALRVKELTRVAGRVDFVDTEVIPGIEDLQVELMTGAGSFAPESLPAASTVVAARIWLLVRAATIEAGYLDSNTYNYAGRSVTPSVTEQRFRRMLLVRTVAIRNAHSG